jgi:hypothetical protein
VQRPAEKGLQQRNAAKHGEGRDSEEDFKIGRTPTNRRVRARRRHTSRHTSSFRALHHACQLRGLHLLHPPASLHLVWLERRPPPAKFLEGMPEEKSSTQVVMRRRRRREGASTSHKPPLPSPPPVLGSSPFGRGLLSLPQRSECHLCKRGLKSFWSFDASLLKAWSKALGAWRLAAFIYF